MSWVRRDAPYSWSTETQTQGKFCMLGLELQVDVASTLTCGIAWTQTVCRLATSMKTECWIYTGRTPVATGRWPAGSVICAASDAPEMRESNSRTVARWIVDGLTIERVPVEWVREHMFTTDVYHLEAK